MPVVRMSFYEIYVIGTAHIICMCTKMLFRPFEAKFEPQPKGHPLEVLEAEHCFEAVVPDGGEETEVDGIGIILQNEFRGEPAVLNPDGANPRQLSRPCGSSPFLRYIDNLSVLQLHQNLSGSVW